MHGPYDDWECFKGPTKEELDRKEYEKIKAKEKERKRLKEKHEDY